MIHDIYKNSIIVCIILLVCSCSATNHIDYKTYRKAANLSNICKILNNNPTWQRSLKLAEKKWGIPAYVIMATMYQESKFIADARPIKHKPTRSIKKKT